VHAQRRVVLWRWATIAFALLVLGLIGVPFYLAAMAMTSARGEVAPPIFHPGWKLLSPAYWQDLLSSLPVCSNHMQLMCPWSIIGWFEIAVLGGAAFLVFAGPGAKRRYGIVIIALLALIHFYALLSMQQVLGRLHTVSTPYLMWAFFPLAAPAAIAAGGAIRSVGDWAAGRKFTMAAGGSKLAHRSYRSVHMGVVHSAEPAASPWTRSARFCADRTRAGEQGSDRRLPSTAHRPEAG
jgi:hypothetical protein